MTTLNTDKQASSPVKLWFPATFHWKNTYTISLDEPKAWKWPHWIQKDDWHVCMVEKSLLVSFTLIQPSDHLFCNGIGCLQGTGDPLATQQSCPPMRQSETEVSNNYGRKSYTKCYTHTHRHNVRLVENSDSMEKHNSHHISDTSRYLFSQQQTSQQNWETV